MNSNKNQEHPAWRVEVPKGQGVQVGDYSRQDNKYIGTYVETQLVQLSPEFLTDLQTVPNTESATTVTALTPLPYAPLKLSGRAEALEHLKNIFEPGTFRQLLGPPGSGKTALLAYWLDWLRLTCGLNRVSLNLVYVDLSGYLIGENPVLRALAHHLNLSSDISAYVMPEPSERLAAVRLAIRRRLGSLPSAIAFDHADLLLAGRSGNTVLSELLEAQVLASASVVLSRRSGEVPTTTHLRVRPPIVLTSLPPDEAGQLLSHESGIQEQVCVDACIAVDEDILQPGTLISALPNLYKVTPDYVAVGESLIAASSDQADSIVRQLLPVIGSEDDWLGWVTLLTHAISGPCLCRRYVTLSERCLQLLSGAQWVDIADGKPNPTNALVRLSPGLIALTVAEMPSRDADTLELIESHLSAYVNRDILEKILARINLFDESKNIRHLKRYLIEVIACNTVNEPLGPALFLTANERTDYQSYTASEVLILARTSATPAVFASCLYREHSRPSLDIATEDIESLSLLRLALRELDGRFDYDRDVEMVRRDIISLFEEDRRNVVTEEQYLNLVLDSCEASIVLGDTGTAKHLVNQLSRADTQDESNKIAAQAQVLAMRLGLVTAAEALPQLRTAWSVISQSEQESAAAILLRISFIRAALGHNTSADIWLTEILQPP